MKYVIILNEGTGFEMVVERLFANLAEAKDYEARYLANDRDRRIVAVPGKDR